MNYKIGKGSSMLPWISIIVPVYMNEKYIKRCVESILLQTFTDVELILIDDGSLDSSGRICDEYAKKDTRVRTIHKENGGVSSSRNLGIVNSRGKYVYFVDSDDYLEPYALQTLFDCIERNSTDIIIFGFSYIINGEKLNKCKLIEGFFNKSEFINNFKEFGKEVYYNSPINKLYLRCIIQDNNILFEEGLQVGEDLLFNLKYFSNCESFYVLNINLYNYYINNPNSLMHRYYDDFDVIQRKLMEQVKLFFQDNVLSHDNKKYLNDYFLNNLKYIIEHYLCSNIERYKKVCKIKEVLSQNCNTEIFECSYKKSIEYYFFKYSVKLHSYWLYILSKKVVKFKGYARKLIKRGSYTY
jgi:glycosyltransferase involved in cell wall biosynthesis